MSNGVIKQIITMMNTFCCIIRLNHAGMETEIPKDKERIYGVAMATKYVEFQTKLSMTKWPKSCVKSFNRNDS